MLPISRPIQHGFLRVPGGLLAALAVIQAPTYSVISKFWYRHVMGWGHAGDTVTPVLGDCHLPT